MKKPRHTKTYLLLIRETGKVRSRKISLRFIKGALCAFIIFLGITSLFTFLYLTDFHRTGAEGGETAELLREIDRFRAKINEQELEISRLTGQVERLKKGINKGSTQRKKKLKPVSPSFKKVQRFDAFVASLDALKSKKTGVFRVRDPQIVVSKTSTTITFKLYKDGFKKVQGRYVILGIRRNKEGTGKPGEAVAYPAKSLVGFVLRPFLGKPFKIKRRFLTIEAKLLHPGGLERFTEIHVLLFGAKREVLFHEQFKAP